MDLDDRLKRIASGVSVSDAIGSYLESSGQPDADPLSDELEATIEIMFLMATVDGNVSEDELDQLRASLQAVLDIEGRKGPDLSALIDEFGARLEKDGWPARLHAAAGKLQEEDTKSFAFRLAAGVAFVDDVVAHAEAAAIDSLGRALKLDADTTTTLLKEVRETLFG